MLSQQLLRRLLGPAAGRPGVADVTPTTSLADEAGVAGVPEVLEHTPERRRRDTGVVDQLPDGLRGRAERTEDQPATVRRLQGLRCLAAPTP